MKDDQQEGEKGSREVERDIRAKSYKAQRAMDKGAGSPFNNTGKAMKCFKPWSNMTLFVFYKSH